MTWPYTSAARLTAHSAHLHATGEHGMREFVVQSRAGSARGWR